MTDESAKTVISHETKITIGMLIVLVGALVWMNSNFSEQSKQNIVLTSKVEALKVQIESLNALVIEKTQDRYTKAESEAQLLRLAILNPNLRVPDPADPSKIIKVERATIGE